MRVARAAAAVAALAAVLAAGASAFGIELEPPPPPGVVGTTYTYVFKPKAGAPPYAFWLDAGDLPPGLKIESDGTMRGTPTAPGTFIFTVGASQCCGPDSQWGFTVKIRDKLTINTTALKSATVGTPYTTTIGVAGTGGLGMGWSVSAGALPTGLALAPDGTPGDGLISGTPTVVGTSTFTVKVGDTDGFLPNRATTKQLTLAVVAPLGVQASTAALPTGVVDKPYKATPASATGGAAPYTWSLAGGTAPPGLAVDPATGAIQGRPTAAGTFSFTVGVTDAEGRAASAPASIAVVQKLELVTTHLRNARVGHPYRTPVRARGGLLPRTWKLKRGKLPAGLRLDGTTGVISGEPRVDGTFRFAVTVTDALGQRSSTPLVLNVRP